MTTKTEQAKREMYDLLESMRRAKKHPAKLARFEDALEAYLDIISERLYAVEQAYDEVSARVGIAEDGIVAQRRLIARQRSAIGELYMHKVAK